MTGAPLTDQFEKLVNVGLSTAAAPTYFSAIERDGYVFSDGGIWANNPAMVGVVDATTCFDIDRTQIRLLSLGCGQDTYRMRWWHRIGGQLVWANQFYLSAMRAQSHNALGQAGLLIGHGKVHMVKADAEAREVLTAAAKDAISRITPQERGFLDRTLARQSRSLAWRRDVGRLMPVLT